jgi:hypothetical protein
MINGMNQITVMLVFHVIDMTHKILANHKEIKGLFREITLGSDKTPSRETVNNLNRLTGTWRIYLEIMRREFPDDMDKLYGSLDT